MTVLFLPSFFRPPGDIQSSSCDCFYPWAGEHCDQLSVSYWLYILQMVGGCVGGWKRWSQEYTCRHLSSLLYLLCYIYDLISTIYPIIPSPTSHIYLLLLITPPYPTLPFYPPLLIFLPLFFSSSLPIHNIPPPPTPPLSLSLFFRYVWSSATLPSLLSLPPPLFIFPPPCLLPPSPPFILLPPLLFSGMFGRQQPCHRPWCYLLHGFETLFLRHTASVSRHRQWILPPMRQV